MPPALRSTRWENDSASRPRAPQYRRTIAAAAPPQSASDWEMNGTSRMDSGRAAGWAPTGAASATHTKTLAAQVVLMCGCRSRSPREREHALIHGHTNQDEHEQGDDDHRRRDRDPRLPPGQGLFRLTRLSGQ